MLRIIERPRSYYSYRYSCGEHAMERSNVR